MFPPNELKFFDDRHIELRLSCSNIMYCGVGRKVSGTDGILLKISLDEVFLLDATWCKLALRGVGWPHGFSNILFHIHGQSTFGLGTDHSASGY